MNPPPFRDPLHSPILVSLAQALQAMPGKRVRLNPALVKPVCCYLLAVARQYEGKALQPARRGNKRDRARLRGERQAAQRMIDAITRVCDALLETVDADDIRDIADVVGWNLTTGQPE